MAQKKGGGNRKNPASNSNKEKRAYVGNVRDIRNARKAAGNASGGTGSGSRTAGGSSSKPGNASDPYQGRKTTGSSGTRSGAGSRNGAKNTGASGAKGSSKAGSGSRTTSNAASGRGSSNTAGRSPSGASGRTSSNAATGRSRASSGSAARTREQGGRGDNLGKKGSTAGKYEEYLKMIPDRDDSLRDEIGLVITALVCILMVLSYLKLCGTFGNYVNTVIFGLFGSFGYAFPFVLFTVVLFAISNKRNVSIVSKTIYCFLIMVDVSAMVQLFAGGFDSTIGFLDYFSNSQIGYAGPGKTYGGLLGGGLCKILCPFLGNIGSGCVMVAGLLILLALILGKAILTAVTRRSAEGISHIRQKNREKREERAELAREREEYERELERRRMEIGEDDGFDENEELESLDEYFFDDEETGDSDLGTITRRRPGRPDSASRRKKKKEAGRSFIDSLMRKGMGLDISRIEETPEYKELKESYGMSDYEMGELISDAVKEKRETVTDANDPEAETVDLIQRELDKKFGNAGNIQVIDLREHSRITKEKNTGYFIDEDPDHAEYPDMSELDEELKKQVASFYDDEHADDKSGTGVHNIAEGINAGGKNASAEDAGSVQGTQVVGTGNTQDGSADGGRSGSDGNAQASDGSAAGGRSAADGFPDSTDPASNGSVNGRRTVPGDSLSGSSNDTEKPDDYSQASGKTSGAKTFRSGENAAREGSGAVGFNTPEQIKAVMEEAEELRKNPPYVFPPIDLLKKSDKARGGDPNELKEMVQKLQSTLESFGVRVRVGDATCGPTVTRYEIYPEQGVKVKNITALVDDIKLALAVPDIRIESPIPGKAAVGIEVPNKTTTPVSLRELIDSEEFAGMQSKLACAIGKDIGGKIICSDIASMPHALVAGSTGSGKSVCINAMILSILYKAKPSEVRLILIDPKRVELVGYNGIPHLLVPVVTDVKKATAALNWAVAEMDDRYNRFADAGVNNLASYNRLMEEKYYDEGGTEEECPDRLPQILIIIDEFCDLMMTGNPKEVEAAVGRLTQLARAAGIHLVIATQRPAVNVITGTIKANIPTRISFSLTSLVDSRTILDQAGAEKLLGKGDMLFSPQGISNPVRLQGAFVSDKEIAAVVSFIKEQCKQNMYSETVSRHIENGAAAESKNQGVTEQGQQGADPANDRDEYFEEAGRLIIKNKKASIGAIQRAYRVGFNRAARIMDQLAEDGVVGPEEGTKPRRILMTMEQFEAFLAGGGTEAGEGSAENEDNIS